MGESDYNSDCFRWVNKSIGISKSSSVEKLQNEIIQAKDSALAYFFATDFGYQNHLMQKVILDNKDAKYAFIFAQNIPNSDIKALQSIVIESKKIKYITQFACFIKQADLKLLESLILKSKNVKI